jgi:hypothetical protein
MKPSPWRGYIWQLKKHCEQMKACSLLFMLVGLTFAVRSQSRHPGGVQGAIVWYSTDSSEKNPALRSRLEGQNDLLTSGNATIATLNYHPSLVFNGLAPLRVQLGSRDLRSASFFTVYQSLDTSGENSIWHFTKNQNTSLVLTTDRMADLSVYRYMNYTDVVRDQPKVNVYVQHKEKDSFTVTDQWWNIGIKPVSPQLPVSNFKGLVPEIIAYDRVLNSRERLQVASYLSIKYGITLTEPGATYLNSAGETIWDGYDYPSWHRNIAGLARDDASGLNQIIATGSNMPGLLTIASKNALPDNSFLLWGDNGRPLTAAERIAGFPQMLQKTWLVKPYGNSFTTDLLLDTKPVDAKLPVKPVYWLAIDPSGQGKFSAATTIFKKMDKLDAQGRAYFNNINWDNDGSGKDVWGIIAGTELLLASVINQPKCTDPASGSLQIKILGGQAPFQLLVQNAAGLFISQRVENAASPLIVNNLGSGKYFFILKDAAQHLYSDSFYIDNQDLPTASSINEHYIIPAGRALQLNAAENMPGGLSWEWSGPDNFQSFNPQVKITQPGLYTLRCTKNGCYNQQDIRVTAEQANILYDVTVFPNPAPHVFRARITLDKPAPVTMTVYSPEGKVISAQKGNGRANYLFAGDLKTAGTYEIVFISGLSKTTKRLVIVK